MAFPTLASLDAVLVPALADSGETGATVYDTDGNPTPCTALFDEVALEGYDANGSQVSAMRHEVEFLRSEVTPVQGWRLTRSDGTRWRLAEVIRRDSARIRFIATPLLGEGA